MALFGKKKQDPAAPGTTVPLGTTVVTPASAGAVDAPAPSGKKAKAERVRAPKSRKARSGSVVGVNIGNHTIKGVEVVAKGGRMTVVGMAIVPTPPDGYQNGAILSNAEMIGALRELWKQGGFKSRLAILSVSGSTSLIVRVVEVPRMTDGQLSDNMRVEADRYIPFPPSEVIMDFKALRELPSDPDAPNMQVLLAAAQREVIDAHVAITQKARLDPAAIDVEPLAAVRALQIERDAALPDYGKSVALLNIGAGGTEISILRGDVVVFTRTIPLGGQALTTAISQGMDLYPVEAEKLKISRGDALAPPGYRQAAPSDDFAGFDAPPPASAPVAASSTTAPSSDPFDLDFFAQGPQSTEPTGGHGQKEGAHQGEGETQGESPDSINFAFNDADLPTTGSDADRPDEPINSGRRADDAGAGQSAPASGALSQGQSQGQSQADAFSFGAFGADMSEEYLPAYDEAAVAASVEEEERGDARRAAVPSAFDFSNFDLPALEENAPPPKAVPHGGAPTTGAPTTGAPATGDGFTFDESILPSGQTDDFASSAEAASPALSFADAPEQTPSASATNAEAPAVIAPVASAPVAPAPVASAPVVNEPNVSSPGGDGIDLDDIFIGDEGAPQDDPFGGAFAEQDVAVTSGATEQQDLELGEDSFGVGLVGGDAAGADEVALYAAMEPVLSELIAEIQRSVEFHLERTPDAVLSHIYLTGGAAQLRNLNVLLTQNLGVECTVLNPFSHVEVASPRPGADFANQHAAECAVAFGLAARDFIE